MAKNPVDGKEIVLTGTLSEMTRKEATEKLEALGAVVRKDITAKRDYLIAGAKAGKKIGRAQKYGVEVRDEAWLIAVLAGRDPDAPVIEVEAAALDEAGLTELLEATDWSLVDPARDLPAVITALHALERCPGAGRGRHRPPPSLQRGCAASQPDPRAAQSDPSKQLHGRGDEPLRAPRGHGLRVPLRSVRRRRRNRPLGRRAAAPSPPSMTSRTGSDGAAPRVVCSGLETAASWRPRTPRTWSGPSTPSTSAAAL